MLHDLVIHFKEVTVAIPANHVLLILDKAMFYSTSSATIVRMEGRIFIYFVNIQPGLLHLIVFGLDMNNYEKLVFLTVNGIKTAYECLIVTGG